MPTHVFLLLTLLVVNVTLRLFTNGLGILPKFLNIADVFLVGLIFLISLSYPASRHQDGNRFRFGRALFGFNVILLLGIALNLQFFYPQAAVSQFIMWNEPLLLFVALMRLPFTPLDIERFRRLLVRLLVVEFVLGVIQVPIYAVTGQTEAIIGTFQGNAEQYQGFMMLGVYYLMARQHLEPGNRKRLWMMISAILFLIVLIDNKASWLGVLASILVVLHLQGRASGRWFRPQLLIPAFVLLMGVGWVVVQFSPSLNKFSGLLRAWQTGNIRNVGKIKAYDDILRAFTDHPHMWAIGSGPGNFYSRSGQQFYLVGDILAAHSAYGRTFRVRVSNSMGGVINPTAQHDPFYEQFYVNREIYRIGSGQVDSPFSSYAALLGETGLLGTLLYLGIYLRVFKRARDATITLGSWNAPVYPFAIAAVGFLVYVAADSAYNSWLETGRMTTILWAMIALTFKQAPEAAHAPEPQEYYEQRFTHAPSIADAAPR